MSARHAFNDAVAAVTGRIAGRPLDEELQAYLNESFPPGGEAFDELATLCRQGIDEGWLCGREQGGIRFGRAIRPGVETHGFSVDVVLMNDLSGPFHGHPTGEIDMIIPESTQAEFDGHRQGWLVYAPGSEHFPTVSGGKAIVLYLLPDGMIDFDRPAP